MSEKKKKNDFSDRPKAEYWNPELCPTCGNNDFTHGLLQASGARVWFKKSGFRLFGRRVEARQCNRCGNVQLFAEQAE